MHFKIYTTPSCHWCKKAKKWLEENGHDYTEIDLSEKSNMSEFFDTCGNDVRTVPQILHEETLIGGYQDLISWSTEQSKE